MTTFSIGDKVIVDARPHLFGSVDEYAAQNVGGKVATVDMTDDDGTVRVHAGSNSAWVNLTSVTALTALTAPALDLDELATKVADILAERQQGAKADAEPPRPAVPTPFEHTDQDGDRFKVEAYYSGGHILSARGEDGRTVLVTLHNHVIPSLIAFLQTAHAANDGDEF